MAQYLPFIPDVLPEPVVYAPDFNFFDKMLQKKQLQYEQGVSKAKLAYQSVLNAPLSDKANIPLRDQYIKQAQEGLKQIAGSDLSLPENQQIAENLYAPFWQDDLMMKDTKLTKWYQSQAERLNSWRTSSDPKMREQYNGITTQYLNNGLSVLQNANRNAGAYDKVERREATPWTNIEGYLETKANEKKMSVKYDDPSGPYLVSTENGQRSKQKYATWAQSMVGNNFYEQFRVSGVVEKEQRAKDIKKLNPTWNDDQVMKFMSNDVISELNDGYKKRTEEVDVELARVNSLIRSMPTTALSPSQQTTMSSLMDEVSQLYSKKAGINEEYKNFDQPDKNKIINAVLANADGYFGVLAKQRVINNWATGAASIESRIIKENTTFSHAQDLEMKRKDYDLSVLKNKQEEYQREWDRQHPDVKATTTSTTPVSNRDAFGNLIPAPVEAVDQTTLGVYQGTGTTDITKTDEAVAFDIFNNYQKQTYKGANDLLFDTKGLLSITKLGLGLNQEDITLVSTFLGKEMKSLEPGEKDYTATKEEQNALVKLTTKLIANDAVKAAGFDKLSKITGPGNFKNALIEYTRDYFSQRLDKSKDGNDVPLTSDEFTALTSYTTAITMLDGYTANEKNRQELIEKNLKTNPEFKSLTTVDNNGKRSLITISDLKKEMPELIFKGAAGEPPIKASKEDVAKMFMQGKLNVGDNTQGGYEIFIDGIKYDVGSINGKSNFLGWAKQTDYDAVMDGVEKKYGTSEEFANKLTKAYQSVVPDLLYYQSKTGRMGQEFYYNFDKKNVGDKATLLFNNAMSPANATIYDKDGKQVKDETADALRALLKNKEENMAQFVQGFTYKTMGTNAKPTISFNIGEISAETKQQIAGVNLDKLNAGEYNLVITDETTVTNLRNLPQNTGNYIYGQLLQGKKIVSDPIISASGFDFELVPNVMGKDADPSSAHLKLTYHKRVNEKDKAGQLVTSIKEIPVEVDFNLKSGENRKTPDEIVNYIYTKYYEVMLANRNTQQEYQKAVESGLVTNPKTGAPAVILTKDEMLRAAGLDPKNYK